MQAAVVVVAAAAEWGRIQVPHLRINCCEGQVPVVVDVNFELVPPFVLVVVVVVLESVVAAAGWDTWRMVVDEREPQDRQSQDRHC